MTRGKKCPARAEPDTQDDEAPPDNLERSFQGCTFPVYSVNEGKLFRRLFKLGISPPRHFDWALVDSLRLRTYLVKYLNALSLYKSLYKLAEKERHSYDTLCLEMLTTFSYGPKKESMECSFWE